MLCTLSSRALPQTVLLQLQQRQQPFYIALGLVVGLSIDIET